MNFIENVVVSEITVPHYMGRMYLVSRLHVYM